MEQEHGGPRAAHLRARRECAVPQCRDLISGRTVIVLPFSHSVFSHGLAEGGGGCQTGSYTASAVGAPSGFSRIGGRLLTGFLPAIVAEHCCHSAVLHGSGSTGRRKREGRREEREEGEEGDRMGGLLNERDGGERSVSGWQHGCRPLSPATCQPPAAM